MAKLSKRMRAILEKKKITQPVPISDAVNFLKETSSVKFEESIDVSIKLSIDPKKSDQNIRGAVVLPHGTGKTKRVAVFAQGELSAKASAAGADVVGFDDLATSIKAGEINFDILIATPDAMRLVGQLGPILGPKGLMPNPKVGTVTTDVENAVKNAKSGQVQFRNDKAGIIHCSVGRISFSSVAIKENLETLLITLKKLKPSNAKGVYLNKIALSSTMGSSLTLEHSSLNLK